MNSKLHISKNIELFYTKASEETRLEKGMGIFEYERVKSLIEKHIKIAQRRANKLKNKFSIHIKELIDITQNDGHLLPFSPHMMIAVKKQESY